MAHGVTASTTAIPTDTGGGGGGVCVCGGVATAAPLDPRGCIRCFCTAECAGLILPTVFTSPRWSHLS